MGSSRLKQEDKVEVILMEPRAAGGKLPPAKSLKFWPPSDDSFQMEPLKESRFILATMPKSEAFELRATLETLWSSVCCRSLRTANEEITASHT